MRDALAAVSNALQNSANCINNCAYPCNNVYSIIQVARNVIRKAYVFVRARVRACVRACACDAPQTWNDYTPEFFFTIILISSPLTLLVALWGMTTDRMRQVVAAIVRVHLTSTLCNSLPLLQLMETRVQNTESMGSLSASLSSK